MLFVPWTILPLRMLFQWALVYAHIMIPCYGAFMIFGAIFTIVSYTAAKVRNNLMKICLVIHSLYGFFALVVFCLMSVK